MDDDSKSVALVLIVAVLAIVMSGWVFANYQPERTGQILLGLAIAGITLFFVGLLANDMLNIDDESEGPEITGAEIGAQSIGGLFAGIIPIAISLATPLSIGLPIIALSVTGQLFASILVAPFVEEVFFLMLAVVVYKIMLKVSDNRGLAILTVLVSVPVTFAAFHWLAYGATFLTGGAFIGAALFRLLTLLMVLAVSMADGEAGFSISSVAPVILAAIIMHAVYNLFVIGSSLSIVGG